MTRGGRRVGAGRPSVAPLSGETKVIRIPKEYEEKIRRLIQEWDDAKSDF